MLELLEGDYPSTAEEYKELSQKATNLGTLVRDATKDLVAISKKRDYLHIRLNDLEYSRYVENNETFETWHAKQTLFGDPMSLVFHSRYSEKKVAAKPGDLMPVLQRVLEAWDYKKKSKSSWTWRGLPSHSYGPPNIQVLDGGIRTGTGYYNYKIRTGVGLDRAIRLFSTAYSTYNGTCHIDEEGKLVAVGQRPYHSYSSRRRTQGPPTITVQEWLTNVPNAVSVWNPAWETITWPTLKTVKSAIKKSTHNRTASLDKDKRKKYLEKVMTDPATISHAIQKRAWVCKICGAVDGTDPSKRPTRRQFGHQWVSLNRTRSRDLELIYNLQIAGCLHRES